MVNLPPLTYPPPPEIRPYEQALLTIMFPSIRLIIKPIFLRGGGVRLEGDGLTSHELPELERLTS